MAIVTFFNNEPKETGQTLSSVAIASIYGIEHNLNILLIPTDFNDQTVDHSYFVDRKKSISFMNSYTKGNGNDFSNGAEGLVRMFAANRASKDIIKSYTKPVLHDRLDILVPPDTSVIQDFQNVTKFYPAVIELANQVYDIVLVDLSRDLRKDAYERILEITHIPILMLRQEQKSVDKFLELKAESQFFSKQNLLLAIGKYDKDCTYTAKNMGRYLREKRVPLTVPYNAHFYDYSTRGKTIDYFLATRKLTFKDGAEGFFYDELRRDVDEIEKIRVLNGF